MVLALGAMRTISCLSCEDGSYETYETGFDRISKIVGPDPKNDDPKNDPEGVPGGQLERGRRSVNVLPAPGMLWTSIRPPWASAMVLAMQRPRPAPPASRERAGSTR